MSEETAYTHLTIETAQALSNLGCADLAVYLPSAGQTELVLYRGAGRGLADPDYNRLRTHGLATVYVRTGDLHERDVYLEERLGDLLHNGNLESIAKAEIVHQVGHSVARGLVNDANSSVDLNRTTRFVEEMVGCVLAEQPVARYLAHMASHHRSTASHMVIVSMLAITLGAMVYGEDRERLRELGLAGMLHDMGKLAIDPAVLAKPETLSPEETVLVQQHAIESVRLLGGDTQATPAVRQMIIQHHERVDGRGYPLGLTGDELDLSSKILTIVDSFHAITGPRSYRAPLTPLEANRVLDSLAGRQFDPDLLACWNALFDKHGTRPPQEWAVSGSEHQEDELATRHEHRTGSAPGKQSRYRPRRHRCDGRISAGCVYAGRLNGVSRAPDRFVSKLQDLSSFGACLRTEHPLFRGEVIHIGLKGRDRPIWLEAVVAWCRQQQDHSGYHCGIRFAYRIREDQVGTKTDVEGLNNTLAKSA